MRFVRTSGLATKVTCPVCGRSGYGPEQPTEATAVKWQEGCLQGHPHECSCGKKYPTPASIAAHIRWAKKNDRPGHTKKESD